MVGLMCGPAGWVVGCGLGGWRALAREPTGGMAWAWAAMVALLVACGELPNHGGPAGWVVGCGLGG